MKRWQVSLSLQLAVLALMMCASTAEAASGFVTGNIKLWNRNGNWCDPALQNCTGARYLRAQYDVAVPLIGAIVELWQGSTPIGFGSSDLDGNFTLAWSSSTLTNTRLRFFAQHAGGRFVIGDTTGNRMTSNSLAFTLVSGTTAGSPQNLGNAVAGTSGNPHWWLNVFWAAERQFRETINLVGALQVSYTGIEIRGIDDPIPGFLGSCPTSCARGSQKRIQIDSLPSALSPQSRIMHESGHVASYLLNPRMIPDANAYCYDGNCDWSRTSPEWGNVAFEEALALHFADVTLWLPSSVAPTSCASQFRCAVNSNNNIEETHWAVNPSTCNWGDEEERWAISVERMLWDVYDSVAEVAEENVSEGTGHFWRLFANVTQYPAGIDDHEIDEIWKNSARTVIDDYDGRNAEDYEFWYANYVDIHDVRAMNCNAK